ncbi:hypothetical protein [Leisingera sp. XS_AS12]|uniref:hypothetical protein n=1 Tax=Leisingera sp. XS_AS12 TaxID=3241294 RepID=UPI003512C428
MPNRKTLIFHIGDHKTGSTSIQLAFAKRLVTIQGHSVFYPAKLARNALGDQCLAYGKAQTPETRQATAKPIAKLAELIRDSKADFTLISAEAFEKVPAALLREVIDTFFAGTADDIRIFGYVRPHAARLTSSFSERTKAGVPKTLRMNLDDFTKLRQKKREFIYLPRFTAWQEQFGDAFTLRPMIRSQLHKGDVVSDFVHHAFGGLPFTITGDNAANESLCLEDLMRLKVLQSHLKVLPSRPKASHDLRLKIGWEFSRLTGQLPPPPQRTKLQLHKSLAEDIRDTYLDDAKAMDREFFGGEPLLENELHAAVEKALDTPQSVEPADYLSASELRSLELMSGMIAGMLEEPTVNWPAFFHAKRVRDVEQARKAQKKQPSAAAE